MQEREESRGGLTVDPRAKRIHGSRAVALRLGKGLAGSRDFDSVVVEIESARQTRLMPHHVCRYSGAGRVVGSLESFGERLRVCGQRKTDVVPNAVTERQQAGQYRGM